VLSWPTIVALAAVTVAAQPRGAMVAVEHGTPFPATLPACPFPSDHPTIIATKHDLPSAVSQALGDMADKGEPFQAGDVILPGRPPWSRFVSAEGRGCDLVVQYERGGRGYSRPAARFRFTDGRW